MPIKNNAYAWYEYALKTGDDSVARFMMHWIAFNFMYSEYSRRDEDGDWNSERDRIERLCKDKYRDLKHCKQFEDLEKREKLWEYPILKGKNRPYGSIKPAMPTDRQLKPQDMTPEELWSVLRLGRGLRRIQCILLTLYQVRCNLFHGSKDPNYPRDRKLIQESATIMQGCMEALLHIETFPQPKQRNLVGHRT